MVEAAVAVTTHIAVHSEVHVHTSLRADSKRHIGDNFVVSVVVISSRQVFRIVWTELRTVSKETPSSLGDTYFNELVANVFGGFVS